MEQGHVFGPGERQALRAVMVHHLWDAGKHTAALVQGVAVSFGLSHDDVNAAVARPKSGRREGGEGEERQAFCLMVQTNTGQSRGRTTMSICAKTGIKLSVC